MFKEFHIENFENSSKLLEELLNNSRVEVEKLLEIKNKTYKNFVLPFSEIGERINEFITPVFHMDSVKNSKINSKVYKKCITIISKNESEISQKKNIYTSFKNIKKKKKSTLNNIQLK